MSLGEVWLEATVTALVPLANPARAAPMAAYMKAVAPFLGISTPMCRSALAAAWKPLPPLAEPEVVAVAEVLITTKPSWDTVDAVGSAVVTPLVARNPDLVDLMWRWLLSGDRWLVRAALQHQRGRKERTDLERLFAMCDEVASDREFFIAKAVGWALRDVTNWDPRTVQSFVDDHPYLSTVARREAAKGLARSVRP